MLESLLVAFLIFIVSLFWLNTKPNGFHLFWHSTGHATLCFVMMKFKNWPWFIVTLCQS